MTLEMLLEDREKWQDNTINRIRDSLLYKPTMNIKKTIHEEKLVVIYGPPQIGKTTLILQLLGIDDAEYRKHVYKILRAGVARGNSSTSTAIIYQQCDSEQFGIKYEKDISGIGGNIEFLEENDLINKLTEIRRLVEMDHAKKDILYIYIPKRYFSKESEKYTNINILDLPGDGSRNTKENSHVKSLLAKYMAIASVNLIVCKANEIQSLEELDLPTDVDWRNLPHKYILIITNSYSQGTIKKYFKQKKSERKETFLDFVKQQYDLELKNIINPLSGFEFFPIDMGDSLQCLLNSGICEEDQKELLETAGIITEEIRKAIQNRNGNSLKATILELKSYSSAFVKNQCENLKKEIDELEKEIEWLNSDFKRKSDSVTICDKNIEDLTTYHSHYDLLNNLNINLDFAIPFENFERELNKYEKNGKIRDGEKKLLSVLERELIEFTKLSIEELHQVVKFNFVELEAQKIYAMLNAAISVESEIVHDYYTGGLFQRKPKRKEYSEKVRNAFEIYSKRLAGYLSKMKNNKIQELKELEVEYQSYCQWKILCKRNIRNDSEKLKRLESVCKEKKEEHQIREENGEVDRLQIEEYSKIAYEEYENQFKALRNQLESEKSSASEKIYLLIFMALLEKDYQSIIGVK